MPETQTSPLTSVSDDAEPYDTLAGIVIGAHGVQGTLKVKPVTSTSSRLFSPTVQSKKQLTVWVGLDRLTGRLVQIVSAKRQEPKGLFLVRLEGIDDRNSAESLIGLNLYGKSEQREALSEDEYFVEDLLGMVVIDRAGHDLGCLTTVHAGVANDVYETDNGLLIPAVKAFIDKIDMESRRITVVDAGALAIE